MSVSLKGRLSPAFCYFVSFATVALGFVFPAIWSSLLSCFILLSLAAWVAGPKWTSFVGLEVSKSSLLWFVLTFVLSSVLVSFVVFKGPAGSIELNLHWQKTWPLILLTVLMQSFAEEVLFRTYLTREFLMRFIPRLSAVVAVSGCFFSLAHLLNYRTGEGVYLSWSPLLTLFLFGCSGTLLFVRQGHVLGAWGFHAGWNFVRFSYELSIDGRPVAESATFELIEGSQAGLVVAALILLAAFFQPIAKASR